MDFHRLEVFCKVVERQSISRAAEDLNLTQPAVSAHIRRLERDVGVRLFKHQGRQIVSSEAAEILYRYARSILEAREEARIRLTEFKEGARGRLIIGASTTGVMYYLPPLLRFFHQSHPDADLVVRAAITDRIREAVAAETIDLALVWGPVSDQRLEVEELGYDHFAVIAHPSHPLATGDPVPPHALADQRFVLPPAGSTTRKFIEARLRDIGVVPNVAMELDSTEPIKRVVEGNLGIAVVSRKGAEQEIAQGTLRIIRVENASFHRKIVMIWRKGRDLTTVARHFIRTVRRFPLLEGKVG